MPTKNLWRNSQNSLQTVGCSVQIQIFQLISNLLESDQLSILIAWAEIHSGGENAS